MSTPVQAMSSTRQLAGKSALEKAQTASKSARVTVAQLARPLTVCAKTVAWSAMQVEYSATVAVHGEGRALQLGVAEPACMQAVSWLAQFACNAGSVGALLDTPKTSPFHLHVAARLMARP